MLLKYNSTCAKSRAPSKLERLINPGDMFIVRNIGNLKWLVGNLPLGKRHQLLCDLKSGGNRHCEYTFCKMGDFTTLIGQISAR
jgi:hypothetical protein